MMTRGVAFAASLLCFLLVPLVACTRAEKSPPADTPVATPDAAPAIASDAAASASPATTAARDLRPWLADWPKAWTDPRVVAVLAEDCSFVPVKPRPPLPSGARPMAVESSSPADVFACDLGYEQSCNPDPCNGPLSTCEGGCTTTCRSCGETCAGSCTSCKAACTDNACKKVCATTCADCKQTCTRTMDRCVTGECSRQQVACSARLRTVWKRNGCKARCAVYTTCVSGCDQAKDPDACREGCAARAAPGEKACNAKCEALGEQEKVAACQFKCFESAPCASAWCMGGYE